MVQHMFSTSKKKVTDTINNMSTNVDIVLGKTSNVKGELSGLGIVRLDGNFEGVINIEGELIVGTNANIIADIKTGNATISGKVRGNIYTQGKVELLAPAIVIGDISAKSIIVEEGARFSGRSQILEIMDIEQETYNNNL